jgi:hypothetical protein
MNTTDTGTTPSSQGVSVRFPASHQSSRSMILCLGLGFTFGPLAAQVEGCTTGFAWAAALVIGAVAAGVLVKATTEDLPADAAVVHAG